MYGCIDSYPRLRFHVISSSFVHSILINNERFLVWSGFVLRNCELWSSVGQLFEEPTGVTANSTGAGCSGPTLLEGGQGFNLLELPKAR